MSLNKRPGPSLDIDLEATDELPALDLPENSESQVNTDIFPSPVIPAGMAELADSLRDVEHRLQRKIERVQKLEADLHNAATNQLALTEQLRKQSEAAAKQEAALRAEITQSSQQNSALAEKHAATQSMLDAARDDLQIGRAHV